MDKNEKIFDMKTSKKERPAGEQAPVSIGDIKEQAPLYADRLNRQAIQALCVGSPVDPNPMARGLGRQAIALRLSPLGHPTDRPTTESTAVHVTAVGSAAVGSAAVESTAVESVAVESVAVESVAEFPR